MTALVIPAGGVHEPDASNITVEKPAYPPPAAEVHVDPLDVSTFPVVPGATNVTAEVPLPRMTLFAVSVLAPVPPEATPVTPPDPTITVPDVAGRVNTVVPATAGASSVTVPDVLPAMTTLDII
jgi:hypothetical protein